MDTEQPEVVWALEGYSKADEFLRTEFPISRAQVLALREVVEPDADDPWMLLCYRVTLEACPAVDAILQCGPPDPALDYVTSAYSAEAAGS
ncbi:hypothetical protein [Streptomyces sp. NPDC059639]|uniref:DUF7683 domain-containing protein n=1 Tax=Streptomyces sp. NPDC059639 TaxID=3346891 RepID=UPI0036B10D36